MKNLSEYVPKIDLAHDPENWNFEKNIGWVLQDFPVMVDSDVVCLDVSGLSGFRSQDEKWSALSVDFRLDFGILNCLLTCFRSGSKLIYFYSDFWDSDFGSIERKLTLRRRKNRNILELNLDYLFSDQFGINRFELETTQENNKKINSRTFEYFISGITNRSTLCCCVSVRNLAEKASNVLT